MTREYLVIRKGEIGVLREEPTLKETVSKSFLATIKSKYLILLVFATIIGTIVSMDLLSTYTSIGVSKVTQINTGNALPGDEITLLARIESNSKCPISVETSLLKLSGKHNGVDVWDSPTVATATGGSSMVRVIAYGDGYYIIHLPIDESMSDGVWLANLSWYKQCGLRYYLFGPHMKDYKVAGVLIGKTPTSSPMTSPVTTGK